MSFAGRVIGFNKSVEFRGRLPEGIRVMNPFKENPEALEVSSLFYRKYFSDENKRFIILGINPGRFGGGATGIPFTDPKRLEQYCGIKFNGYMSHETSSVFVYEMIDAFGGPEKFYSRFFISAVCPLGFTSPGKNGREINYNYYDSRELTDSVYDFMVDSIRKQLDFGVYRNVCFCLGTGKNEKFLRNLNEKYNFFEEIIALEHPRFIMQYKSKSKEFYIQKYLNSFRSF